ncbi:hypothetical protein EV193_102403 [Herbihabitans rhizosphaerae]|uniref:Uncharacterized protein n=1 Tax=Herbihabitans rhizosphaerae TaxID=1872711 RepID=A0A4Q7L2P5_9PSEU|nr:hypothetical protein EV193_102403 [Herbihabitans rhizosphaerae]
MGETALTIPIPWTCIAIFKRCTRSQSRKKKQRRLQNRLTGGGSRATRLRAWNQFQQRVGNSWCHRDGFS